MQGSLDVIVVVIKVNIDKTFSLDEAANAPDYQRDIHQEAKGLPIHFGC